MNWRKKIRKAFSKQFQGIETFWNLQVKPANWQVHGTRLTEPSKGLILFALWFFSREIQGREILHSLITASSSPLTQPKNVNSVENSRRILKSEISDLNCLGPRLLKKWFTGKHKIGSKATALFLTSKNVFLTLLWMLKQEKAFLSEVLYASVVSWSKVFQI